MLRFGNGVLAAVAAGGLMALAAVPAAAADYPERSVDFIVPFNAGGGADSSQRAFNKFAEGITGQSMVVVNKPGAGGTVGWAEAVRRTPDGYGLTLVTPPYNIIPALATPKQTGYKLDDFKYLCIYAAVPDVLLVREDSPYQTLDDLIKFAKDNPEKIKASNTGTLGADFMTTLLIEDAAGVKFTQIPFTGGSQALQGVLSGTVDAMVASSIFAVSQKGKLRTLAIASQERDANLPDIPTFKELGYDVVSERYRAIAGPKDLPADIVSYWAEVCKKVTDDAKFREEMNAVGQPVVYHGPEAANAAIGELGQQMQALVEKYDLAK